MIESAPRWVLGRRWLAVMCNPRQEGLAAHNATQAGWGVFYPRYEVIVTHGGGYRPVVRAYLPGYMFAAATRLLDPYDLQKTHGVAKVLRDMDGYYEIPDTDPVMRALLAMCDVDGLVAGFGGAKDGKLPITRYHVGQTIRIAPGGPLAGLEGLVAKLDRKRRGAEVWLEILGGATKAFVPDEQIEEMEGQT